jgi:hypothetical protein
MATLVYSAAERCAQRPKGEHREPSGRCSAKFDDQCSLNNLVRLQ